MEKYEIKELLRKLKRFVKFDRYTTVYRGGRKRPVNKAILKAVIAELTVKEFDKRELDNDGSGEYVYIFLVRSINNYYIKFKFINENDVELVKFISFHP